MLDDLMSKLEDAQLQMEKTKKELDSLLVETEVEGGLVKVKANGNNKIVNLEISDELIKDADKESIEDLVILAINRAIEKAEKLSEDQLAGTAQGIMPDIGSMFGQ